MKKLFIFLILICFPTTLDFANCIQANDSHDIIIIKTTTVQGSPRTSSIQATINGHVLSIVFLENLGQVSIEVSNLNGAVVETTNTPTPHGVDMYIPNTGSYIVTLTLSNGDEYYGEFEVTD